MPKQPKDAAAATEAPQISPEEYKIFVEGLEIENIRLTKLSIEAPHAYASGRPLLPTIDTSISEYVKTETGFVVLHDLLFEGRFEGEVEPAVSLSARYEVSYTTTEPIRDEVFSIFKKTSLPINTWPYFRELVHTALARVGWPALVLPVYRRF